MKVNAKVRSVLSWCGPVIASALILLCARSMIKGRVATPQVEVINPTTAVVVEPGGEKTFQVTLVSLVDYEMMITSVETSCDCTTSSHLPLLLLPRGQRDIPFTVTSNDTDSGSMNLQLRFYVDPPLTVPVTEVAVLFGSHAE